MGEVNTTDQQRWDAVGIHNPVLQTPNMNRHGPYYGFEYVDVHTGHAYPAGHWRVWLERNHPEGLTLWRKDQALEQGTGVFQSWKNALPAEWHYTHWTGDRTVDWLSARNVDRPFFCGCHLPIRTSRLLHHGLIAICTTRPICQNRSRRRMCRISRRTINPAYVDVRRRLTDRLLAELIDSELGDPALVLSTQAVTGALRDRRQMEAQPHCPGRSE